LPAHTKKGVCGVVDMEREERKAEEKEEIAFVLIKI
jgi:hypothetical protein